MIQALQHRTRRAERAAVRDLAARVDAARLVAGRHLSPGDDLDGRVNALLGELWRRRFGGELSPEELPGALADCGLEASARALEPLTSLFGQPCSPRLAVRLGEAHELTLRRRLRRRGRGVELESSEERRRQGAYYTPADVVAFLVEETLGAALASWEEALPSADAAACKRILKQARRLRVLDPACGGGAFLLGALERLRGFYRRLATRQRALGARPARLLAAPGRLALESLRAVDIDAQALALAELGLLAAVAEEPGATARLVGRTLRCGDHLDLPWQREAFAPVFARRDPGFDVVVGNPPYAPLSEAQREVARASGFAAVDAKDIYVLFVEASARVARGAGRTGLIVPLSLVFSRHTRSLREQVLLPSARRWRLASFDRIPSGLFDATVRTRTTLVFAGPRGEAPGVEASCLQRFTAAQRSRIFEGLDYVDVAGLCRSDLGFPKLGSELQGGWLRRFAASGACLGDGVSRRGAFRLHYKQNCYGFAIVAATLPPAFGAEGEEVEQSKYGSLGFETRAARDAALALCAGKWLFWWWLVYGDGFDVTGKLISALPIDPTALDAKTQAQLARLGRRLDRAMRGNVAYKKNGGKRIGTFDLRRCRRLTDEADALIAGALGAQALLADVRAFVARTHGAG